MIEPGRDPSEEFKGEMREEPAPLGWEVWVILVELSLGAGALIAFLIGWAMGSR